MSGEQQFQFRDQFGDTFLNRIPHSIVVNAQIFMDDAVTHPNDRSPFDLWIGVPKSGRHSICSLTDNLKPVAAAA